MSKFCFIINPKHLLSQVLCGLLSYSSGVSFAEQQAPLPVLATQQASLPESMRNGTQSDPCLADKSQGPLNLLEVVHLVLCNNSQTHEVWANARVQAAQVGVTRAGYYPSVNLDASATRTRTDTAASANQRNLGVTLSYLLYDFGARAANLESARQLLEAAHATQDSTVQRMFLAAVQAFYQVQATQGALDAANESELAAKESYAAAAARYSAGVATPVDKLQAQTAYSQSTLNRISAHGDFKNAQGTLANLMGLDANHSVSLIPANTQIMPADFAEDVSALIEQARQQRTDLQAAAAQLKASQASADAARAAGRPNISLLASADQYNSAGVSSQGTTVGINLRIPIFSGYAPSYRVSAAEAQSDVLTAQLEQLRLKVALDVWTTYQQLTTATQALRSSADLLNSAEQSERVVRGRYKAGVGNILDLLNAQSALASARQQRIQATFSWNISRAALAHAMGSLDVKLVQSLIDTGN